MQGSVSHLRWRGRAAERRILRGRLGGRL